MLKDAFIPPPFRRFRRSTRVPLTIRIEAQGVTEYLTCEGQTIVVNLHGALIQTSVALTVGMQIEIHVYLTAKRAAAEVVYLNSEKPFCYGIELAKPQNIWGISLLPDDWDESNSEETR
jgi:hypothetical protein